MKILLVPVDITGLSTSVVTIVAELARGLKARVHLLHIDVPIAIPVEGTIAIASYDETSRVLHMAAQKSLLKTERLFKRKRLQVMSTSITGSVAEGILTTAKKIKPAFVVIGSRPHGTFYDLFVGSTSAAIFRDSAYPLIMVPAKKLRK